MKGTNKRHLSTVGKVSAIVAAVLGYAAVQYGMDRYKARKKTEERTAGWDLAPAARDRVLGAIEEGMALLSKDPLFLKYVEEQVAAKAKEGVRTEPSRFGKSLGRALTARGVPRLSDEDIAVLQGLKKKMVFASARACPCYWDSSSCSEADIMDGLARLSDPDLSLWARLAAKAGLAELRADKPLPSTQSDLQNGIAAIAERVPVEQRDRFNAVIDRADATKPPTKEDQCFAIQTMFATADLLEPQQRLRFVRAFAHASAAE